MLLVAAISSISMSAKTIVPVIFDDPDFDIRSTELTPEQRSFYDYYIQAMERIEAGEDAEKFFVMEHAKAGDEGVEPLLGDINFDQGAPYNNKCPYLNGGRAVTGCVATAMAMVMRYYKYPNCGTGTFTYTGGSDGAKSITLDDHPFDWPNMLPTYRNGNYSQEQADAVATLMLACGASLNMNYSKDGSGANVSKVNGLLKNNFFYHKDASFISTENSSNPDETIYYWGEDAVRPDLEAGRPLIFAGYPAVGKSGHCFVIDGYKVEDDLYYYHVNWGWGGSGNSWCLLNYLTDGSGTNYAGHNLQMVYNIYPGSQDIENVDPKTNGTHKFVHNGQLFIERNNTLFSPLGQRVE